MGAIADIYSEAPYISALIFSFVITVIYNGKQTHLFSDIRVAFFQLEQVESRTRFLLWTVLPDQIIHNLYQRTTLPLIFIAAFLVPVAIILTNYFMRKDSFGKN